MNPRTIIYLNNALALESLCLETKSALFQTKFSVESFRNPLLCRTYNRLLWLAWVLASILCQNLHSRFFVPDKCPSRSSKTSSFVLFMSIQTTYVPRLFRCRAVCISTPHSWEWRVSIQLFFFAFLSFTYQMSIILYLCSCHEVKREWKLPRVGCWKPVCKRRTLALKCQGLM